MLAQLPRVEEATVEASPSAEVLDETTEKIEILDTPVGFLRVRSAPATTTTEAGQVKPKEEYVLLETSKDLEWYKIEYKAGKEGWVSSQYAKKKQ